jgi:hypothetical protein
VATKITIPIKGGARKVIAFGANELEAVETMLGIDSVMAYLQSLRTNQTKFGVKALRAFVWAGLAGAGGDFSPEETGELIDMTKFGDYLRAITRAVNLTWTGNPDPSPKELEEVGASAEDPPIPEQSASD